MCKYYESNAKCYVAEIFSTDKSEQYQRYLLLLKDGAKIQDVGGRSGCDASYSQTYGYQMIDLESSKNLV